MCQQEVTDRYSQERMGFQRLVDFKSAFHERRKEWKRHRKHNAFMLPRKHFDTSVSWTEAEPQLRRKQKKKCLISAFALSSSLCLRQARRFHGEKRGFPLTPPLLTPLVKTWLTAFCVAALDVAWFSMMLSLFC